MSDYGQQTAKRCTARPNRRHCLAGKRALWCLFSLLILAVSSPGLVRGQTIDPQREANVKAVFLYSFGRYVTWPDSSYQATGGDFVVAIYGDSPVTAALSSIARKRTIGGRKIVVHQVSSSESVPACQILFVARSVVPEEADSLLASVQSRHVLVVGESTEFARRGGAVGFYVAGDTVRFALNVAAARRHSLTLNAKILSLGKRVDATSSSRVRPNRGDGTQA